MARYQERFQGKKQVFLIRNGEAADAPAVMRYMSQVNRETTFLSMEAGEFEKVFSLEKETQLLAEWAPSQYHLSLLAQTEAGEIAASCNCSYSTEKRRYRHRASLGLSVRQDYWRQGLGRRLLQVAGDGTDANGTAGYISYGALYADRVPCTFQGASYYNCRPGAEANPYERGCSAITMCRD